MNQQCPKCLRLMSYIGPGPIPPLCTCNEGTALYKQGYRDGYRDGQNDVQNGLYKYKAATKEIVE